jgi:hypothetical protein
MGKLTCPSCNLDFVPDDYFDFKQGEGNDTPCPRCGVVVRWAWEQDVRFTTIGLGSYELRVGDLVEAVGSFRLRSGCSQYNFAVVVQVLPLVLISQDGDMRWSATVDPTRVRPVGQATEQMMATAMKRFEADKAAGLLQ